jgi:uncharacterized OB-fold protein
LSQVNRVPGFACPKCKWSGVFKPGPCPNCHNPTVQEATFSSNGKVATFTVIRYPPADFEGEAPYVVALIDIEEGPRVMGRIVAKAEEVEIGKSVTFIGNSNGRLEFTL